MEKYSTVNIDLIPTALSIINSDEKIVKTFAFKISQHITNPNNSEETIEEFKSGEFQEYIKELDNTTRVGLQDTKYISYLQCIAQTIDTCGININEVLLRESANEIWVIAEKYTAEDSEIFYQFAFDKWKNIIMNTMVLFVGEDQLNREQMPYDLKKILSCK